MDMDNNSSSSTRSSTSTHTDNISEPAILASSSFQSSSRNSPFLGFTDNSKQDEVMVQALTVYNPFKADHGAKGATWDQVLEYLMAIDEVGARRGQPSMFAGVTAKTCRSRWDALFARHQKRIEAVLEKTGNIPIDTEHDRGADNRYKDKVENDKAKSASKEMNEKKRKRQQQNRALRAALRSASLDKACYRFSPSSADDGGFTSSASSSAQVEGPSTFQPTKSFSSRFSGPQLSHSAGSSQTARSRAVSTGKDRIGSDYKRRRRITEDITKMRSKLIKDHIKRHEDTEAKCQQQTDDIVRAIQEGNRGLIMALEENRAGLIMALEENRAKQNKVLDTVAILLQKLVEK
ncbi:hypothetical protein EC957_011929 [Mortierella hygrophila]|uniref:Myb-like domain-containing protein n=1 Tax=Mortierella hygrophila TaxID=979708 RepID=A0A9P6F759_9FUNG|nr:hypothetical protein EC957_011929 [Mortierella hygrophila]